MNNYKYLIIFVLLSFEFDSKLHFPSISMMTSSMMTSLNLCQKNVFIVEEQLCKSIWQLVEG